MPSRGADAPGELFRDAHKVPPHTPPPTIPPPPVWEVPGTKKRVWSEIAASVPSTFDSIPIPSFASNLRQIRQKNSKQQVLERG